MHISTTVLNDVDATSCGVGVNIPAGSDRVTVGPACVEFGRPWELLRTDEHGRKWWIWRGPVNRG